MAEERIKTHLLMGFIKEKLVVTRKTWTKVIHCMTRCSYGYPAVTTK